MKEDKRKNVEDDDEEPVIQDDVELEDDDDVDPADRRRDPLRHPTTR
jgi:hypothetical protein